MKIFEIKLEYIPSHGEWVVLGKIPSGNWVVESESRTVREAVNKWVDGIYESAVSIAYGGGAG